MRRLAPAVPQRSGELPNTRLHGFGSNAALKPKRPGRRASGSKTLASQALEAPPLSFSQRTGRCDVNHHTDFVTGPQKTTETPALVARPQPMATMLKAPDDDDDDDDDDDVDDDDW